MLNNLSETLQSFFGNFSFALLFFAMVCYWIDTAFFDATKSLTKEAKISKTGFFTYSLPTVNYLKLENIATAAMVLANISLIILLSLRWQNSGHFPLSNLYESLMFLCWSCTSIYLFILKSTYPLIKKSNQSVDSYTTVGNPSPLSGSSSVPIGVLPVPEVVVSKRQTFDLFFYKLLGSIASPCALFINAYATFSLPKEMQNAAPLVPALQSNWLMMHVTVMIISYSALMLGSLLAIAFLIVGSVTNKLVVTSDIKVDNLLFQTNTSSYSSRTTTSGTEYTPIGVKGVETHPYPSRTESGIPPLVVKGVGQASLILLPQAVAAEGILPTTVSGSSQVVTDTKTIFGTQDAMQILAKNLDNLSYRILGIGFPFLTIGILSGAVWANEAWGSYWSWDPKETWALLTWLVFAIYLHMRLSHGWQGRKPAIMASLGFLTVWFCFLGVNLLGEGLHSYGWVLN